jgi:DNA-binding CsgD family transcriptional regulator
MSAIALLGKTGRSGKPTPTNILSGSALIGFDADLRVLIWNDAAEKLTGTSAEEAVGRYCWDLVRGRAEDGLPFCGPNCELARKARGGSAVPCGQLILEAVDGPRSTAVSTITLEGEGPLFLHVVSNPTALPPHKRLIKAHAHLTGREHEILELLADGVPAKVIATSLGISVSTVRNHIRSILAKLHAQSQLQALARARALGII